jgi:hypothetical protein
MVLRAQVNHQALGWPITSDDRQVVELALQASRWLGSSVLQPAAAGMLA